STNNRRSRAAFRRLLLLGFALMAIVLVGVSALLAEGSRRLNDLKGKEDRTLIANMLDRMTARAGSDVPTVTVGDRAYENLRPGGDAKWVDAEVGAYLAKNRGFARSVALDVHDA